MARFELKATTDVSWELPQGLFVYVAKCMTLHVSNRILKDEVLVSPRPHNMKETPVLVEYMKEIFLENRKNLTVNHEDGLKSIQDRIGHTFCPLLQLWSIKEEEKEETLADRNTSRENTSKLKQISLLFDQSVSFLCQAFNSTSYHRRNSILNGAVIKPY